MVKARERPLCLVGMSGVGKSHAAKRLAIEHGFTHHDCDALIARQLGALVTEAAGEAPVHALGRWMGMPWSQGYADREQRYLALEASVTRAALDRATAAADAERHVIDTTGSVIYLPESVLAQLARDTEVVYLRASDDDRERMLALYLSEPKPVVFGGLYRARDPQAPEASLPECYAALLVERDARYRALATHVVDAEDLRTPPKSVLDTLAPR